MPPEQVAAAEELATACRVTRAADRFCHKKAWRQAVLLRTTRTALTLRAIERVLDDKYLLRVKNDDRRWAVFARDGDGNEVLFALVGGGSTRRLEGVRAPIPVELVTPSLVDLDAFRCAVGADIPSV